MNKSDNDLLYMDRKYATVNIPADDRPTSVDTDSV